MNVEHIGSIRRIAIIGAGPAGVATAKYLLAEQAFEVIDVFEQRSSLGGVWNYTEDTFDESSSVPQNDPNKATEGPIWKGDANKKEPIFISPMYDKLITNLPHPLMQFSDQGFPDGTQLFPPRQTVLRYLEDYAREVTAFIRFQTQVLDVRSCLREQCHFWSVKTQDVRSQRTTEGNYDAVVVASGHYTVPHIPDIKGMSAWNNMYPGAILHSKFYRTPDRFCDKKVVLVGYGASGVDIGSQISEVCQLPLLVSQRQETYLTGSREERVKKVPEIAEFLLNHRALKFRDDTTEEGIDAVVFCTGYRYSYPFLSSLQPPLIDDGLRTQHVYQHMFYINQPTLAFVAVPQKIVPFPLSESQAAIIARVWSGRLKLPCIELMNKCEEGVLSEQGSKDFHRLGFPKDADYINGLHEWSLKADQSSKKTEKLPPKWGEKECWTRERVPAIKKAFADRGEKMYEVRQMEELGFDFERWKRGDDGLTSGLPN